MRLRFRRPSGYASTTPKVHSVSGGLRHGDSASLWTSHPTPADVVAFRSKTGRRIRFEASSRTFLALSCWPSFSSPPSTSSAAHSRRVRGPAALPVGTREAVMVACRQRHHCWGQSRVNDREQGGKELPGPPSWPSDPNDEISYGPRSAAEQSRNMVVIPARMAAPSIRAASTSAPTKGLTSSLSSSNSKIPVRPRSPVPPQLSQPTGGCISFSGRKTQQPTTRMRDQVLFGQDIPALAAFTENADQPLGDDSAQC
jgi:hypothetical protein